MRTGLAAVRCKEGKTRFNLKQIHKGLEESSGKAELLVFGEAYLQGPGALSGNWRKDRRAALSLDDPVFTELWQTVRRTGVDLFLPFIEKEGEALYSSAVLIGQDGLLWQYRRISGGWTESGHAREGSFTSAFDWRGRRLQIALGEDPLLYPERFAGADVLIWPVSRELSAEEEAQAGALAPEVFVVSSGPRGGALQLKNGQPAAQLPLDEAGILYCE